MSAVVSPQASLTFNNEGQSKDEDKPFYTLKAHHPDTNSGVTIGKGYDMKHRSENEIKQHLKAAGVNDENASKLAKGAGKIGKEANDFIATDDVKDIRLTNEQEIALFNVVYLEAQKDVERICSKPDINKVYGTCDWSQIDSGIKAFAIDLRFRGDYSGSDGFNERANIQKAIQTNDYDTLITVASDKTKWKGNLDNNRFSARIQHLKTSKQLFNAKTNGSK